MRFERQNHQEWPTKPESAHCNTIFQQPASVEVRQRLTDAILRLPDHERLVFTLYYYEELTKEEVGLLLGETGSSVSQLHASALMHLEARLSD